jgi:DNA-binding transcriptional ArsR family regulator
VRRSLPSASSGQALSVALEVDSDVDFDCGSTTPNFSLDNMMCVTVRLHIMRNRSVTYSSEATFQALADPTRRAVLDLLRRGSQPAGEIAQAFPISRPAISKHLRLLRRAHLVREHREGRHRVYQLNPDPLRAVDSWLDQYRNFWKMNLTNLKSFVEAEYAKETSAPKSNSKTSKGDR